MVVKLANFKRNRMNEYNYKQEYNWLDDCYYKWF